MRVSVCVCARAFGVWVVAARKTLRWKFRTPNSIGERVHEHVCHAHEPIIVPNFPRASASHMLVHAQLHRFGVPQYIHPNGYASQRRSPNEWPENGSSVYLSELGDLCREYRFISTFRSICYCLLYPLHPFPFPRPLSLSLSVGWHIHSRNSIPTGSNSIGLWELLLLCISIQILSRFGL